VSRNELFNEIRNRLAATEKTLLVSIDGPAGAGKTTLAKELTNEFTNSDVIHMDDLYRGWALTLGPNLTRELLSIIEQVNEGGSATYAKFNWHNNQIGEEIKVTKPSLLILEGVGSAQSALDELVDIKVWIEVPIELGLARVLERDGQELAEAMAEFIEQQESHFTAENTKQRADFHLSGN
jgi:uridine kinase